jgi:hypothetical protein
VNVAELGKADLGLDLENVVGRHDCSLDTAAGQRN